MFHNTRSFVTLVFLIVSVDRVISLINDSHAIQDFLSNYNKQLQEIYYNVQEATWKYRTNLTDYNQQLKLIESIKSSKYKQEAARNASSFDLSVMSSLDREQFVRIMDIGIEAQTNETKLMRLNKVKSDLLTSYSTAKFCLNKTLCVTGESSIQLNTPDYDLLTTIWKGTKDVFGKDIKQLYSEYVELNNEAVRITGYSDTGANWRSSYKAPTFEEDVMGLYGQLRPLYEQLHAYYRRKLKAIYGNNRFPSSGHIPAHIHGTHEMMPYPNKTMFDVTEEMMKQNYTVLKIFQMADEFFQSLGLIPMPPEFWNKSMFENPNDGRDVECMASAWDFYNGKDFRIKQCTEVNMYYLYATHHEMGHIQYFLQYSTQPVVFKNGANPGFHEAIGDVISLSVHTPEHMHAIGLLKTLVNDTESDINFLMTMAMTKVWSLPFTFMIDQWRWKVFRGEITPDKYNEEWWNLVCCYEGKFPPVKRTSDNFDPGSIYHILGDVPVMRYFVSYVIQFQFYKALCDAAGHTGPLHRCDIYNSKAAGKILSDVLKLGSSVPWTVAMHKLTGQSKMDARPLMEYFKPLMEYLKSQNGDDYGWQPQCPPPPIDEVTQVSESVSVVEPGERCHLPADIIFLVDASSTVWITDFNRHVKKFLKDMIVSFNVGPGPKDKRVGVLLFSNETYLQFHLNGYQETTYSLTDRIRFPIQTVKEKLCSVEAMRHRGGLTYTHKALEYAASEMLKPENGARPTVPKIVIVLTFGMPSDMQKAIETAKSLNNKGVDIFSIGIGSLVSSNELKALTSSQSEQFVFEAADFRTLDNIKNRLETSICELLSATTTESHTKPTITTTSTTIQTTTEKSTTTKKSTTASSTTNGSLTTKKSTATTIELPSETQYTNTWKTKCSRKSINIMFVYEYINHVSSFNNIINDMIVKFIEKAEHISPDVNIGVLTQNCIGDGVKLSKVSRFREDIAKVRQCYSKGYLSLMMTLRQSVFNNVPKENRKVAVLVVDNMTRNLKLLGTEIHQLKAMNVEIFVVAIGGVKREVLEKLTSGPYSDHIIEVKEENDFKGTNMDVLNMVCGLNFEKETK